MPEETLAKVLDLIREKGLTLGAAESCTGGLFSHTITNVPGASELFKGSVIAYSAEVKSGLLTIPQDELIRMGEVSGHTANHMAVQAAQLLKTDVGVGITGNAGPTAEYGEVGDVYISVCGPKGVITRDFSFQGSRVDVKLQAVEAALDMIIELLEE